LTKEIDAVPKGKSKKDLQAQLTQLQDLYNFVKG